MYWPEFVDASFWWICPILMIAFCFLMMRERKGMTMCGFGTLGRGRDKFYVSESALEILDRRYALGEIDKEEYEEKKSTLNQSKQQIP